MLELHFSDSSHSEPFTPFPGDFPLIRALLCGSERKSKARTSILKSETLRSPRVPTWYYPHTLTLIRMPAWPWTPLRFLTRLFTEMTKISESRTGGFVDFQHAVYSFISPENAGGTSSRLRLTIWYAREIVILIIFLYVEIKPTYFSKLALQTILKSAHLEMGLASFSCVSLLFRRRKVHE